MTILYTSGNTNLDTVRLVASEIKKQCEIDGNAPFHKIMLFASPQALKKMTEQSEIYYSVFGSGIRIEIISLDIMGNGTAKDISAAFAELGPKYIDITNGQKTTAAQLYLSASFLNIDKIFYALLSPAKNLSNPPKPENEYRLIKVPPFTGVEDLSKINYFDLIFYLDDIAIIFNLVKDGTFLSRVKNDLQTGIMDFFRTSSYRSVISNITTSSEQLIKSLLQFLAQYELAKNLCEEFNINLFQQRDSLGAISFFFKRYSQESAINPGKYRDACLEALITIPGLLTPFRDFRNLSAHSGISPHKFVPNEARICINLAIQIFRTCKESNIFWHYLMELV